MKVLLQHEADIESRSIHDLTPLDTAIDMVQLSVVKLLLEKGAKLQMENCYGWLPLTGARLSLNYSLNVERFSTQMGTKDHQRSVTLLEMGTRRCYHCY